jgi:signal transduction histidine kinase
MRNDLNKVQAWTELLVDEDDPETRAEQYARIEPTLEKWEKMTETLQKIRQALHARRDLEADITAGRLVSEAVSESRRRHPDATVEATVPDGDTRPISPLLDRALRELIDNAVQASDADDAHVEVVLSRPDEDWTAIEVVDDGPGLPEMEAEVLETGEETQLAHGGGLGLWMVRMLVTGTGGDIDVDVTSEGTSVRLLIPTAG